MYVGLSLISRTSPESVAASDPFYGPSQISLGLATRWNGDAPAPSWLAMGQPMDEGIGSVSIYELSVRGGTIVLNTVVLKPPDGQLGDRFGCSVAIFDNKTHIILFIGSLGHNNSGLT